MALVDDALGFVVITLTILIAAILITSKTVSRGVEIIKEKSAESQEKFYSSTMDTFLRLDNNELNTPFNILIGNYMADGKRFYTVNNKTIDVKIPITKSLDGLYGSGMYYSKIKRPISNLFLSFVLDGSDSIQDERIEIANNADYILKNINKFFINEDTKINHNFYILTEKGKNEVCSVFSPEEKLNCKPLSFNDLYNSTYVSPPTFGYQTYLQWLSTNPFVKTQPELFFRGDWIAGLAYANKKYVDYVNEQGLQNSLHILIPVSGQLSTGSVADTCFRIKNGDYAYADYTACALCDDACPAERSNQYLKQATDDVVSSSTIVIPVFSFRCNFHYREEWSHIVQTSFNSKYGKFPSSPKTICEDPKCKGCEADPMRNLNAFCFHKNCHNATEIEMSHLANATSGNLIDITNISELPAKIIEMINESLNALALEVGVRDTERTRYVIERQILMPNYLVGKFDLWVYTELFEDREKPMISNVSVFPAKGRNGTIFTIKAIVVDNSSVRVQSEIPLKNSSTAKVSMEESADTNYIGYLDSSGFEQGDYFVSIDAIDARGNEARLGNAAKFQINNSDEIPPVILALWFDPKTVQKSDGWINIWANVTDNNAVQSVKFLVTYPAGEKKTLSATTTNEISYVASLTGLTAEGVYTVAAEAFDFSANKATKSGSFKVMGRKFRIIFAPVGFSEPTSITNVIQNTIIPYLAAKYPTKTCLNPVDRFDAVIIDPDLCKSLICSQSDCAGCYGCFNIVDACYVKYKQTTGDNEPFTLILGIVPGTSCGGYAGCAGISYPYSFSVQRGHVVAHESGHSMGLCHVGPTGGSCDNPEGIDEGYCPNKKEIESEECMMNYCSTQVKNFCSKGFAYLKSQMKNPVNYLEGC